MKKILLIILFFAGISSVFSQVRTFNDIFPSINAETRNTAFSIDGHISYYKKASGFSLLGGSSSKIDPQITSNVIGKNPGYVVESINVIQCNSANLNMLDIYNSLGNIRGLKGRLYDSHSRGQPTPLFEDATRIVSEKNTNAVPDPLPANKLPSAEIFFVRLKDVNFGNTFYRGEVAVVPNGLRYSLTNFKNISYLFVTVIKQEQFTAQLYIEPISEGVLIYSIAGVDISDFAASRINIESAIAKRLGVITSWASDEIKKKVK